MNIKDQIDTTVKTLIFGVIAAASGTVAFLFAVVAAFLWAQQRYDSIVASWIAAALFLLVAVIALVSILVTRRRAEARRAREEAEAAAAAPGWLSDPAMLIAAVQVARSVGLGKLVPFVVAGAAAFGAANLMSGRKRPPRNPDQSGSSRDSDRAA